MLTYFTILEFDLIKVRLQFQTESLFKAQEKHTLQFSKTKHIFPVGKKIQVANNKYNFCNLN